MADTTLVKKSVNTTRLTSRRGLMERLFSFWFDSFVYNQIWEDPRVDLQALELDGDSRILTIASGGCNIMNYLIEGPASITAVDINRYHIFFTRLKLAALKHLPSYDAFFQFFGAADDKANLGLYQQHIREHLDPETRRFWEGSWLNRRIGRSRIKYFQKNVYNYAKLGYLLRFIHGLCRLTGKDPWRILEAKSKEEQEAIFNETIAPFFNNRLIKLIGRNPLVRFSLGIPPEQYEAMKREMDGDIIDLYRERVKRLACDFPIEDNYFLWQALTRKYDLEHRHALPEYLKPDGYAKAKQYAERAEILISHLTEFTTQQPPGALNRFVLLDSQDWMKPPQMNALWTEIARVGQLGTRVIFRTGAGESPIEANLEPDLRARFRYEKERSKELHAQDRSAIYGGFHLYVLEKPL